MSEETKQLLICTIGIILFIAMSIAGLTYNASMNNDLKAICLEQGHKPDDC